MMVASPTLRDITAAATLNLNGASTSVANYYCLIARVMSPLRRRLLRFKKKRNIFLKKRKMKDKHFLEIASNLTGRKTLYGNPIKRYRITSRGRL
jgi:hypothetical protein